MDKPTCRSFIKVLVFMGCYDFLEHSFKDELVGNPEQVPVHSAPNTFWPEGGGLIDNRLLPIFLKGEL